MKILITGDLVVSSDYDSSSLIDNQIISLFRSSDYNIVNLEAPVTSSVNKINKTGPHIKSNLNSTEDVLSTLKIDITTLANNHILDYDQQGVIETLDFCKNHNISTVGAGKNKIEASKPLVLETTKGKIGIINIAENEWASATENTSGANGMNVIEDFYAIREIKKKCEFVIVIVHGGHEYYNLPSPRIQKQYRFYVESGADLVISHHTHCISGMEVYNNKEIYYGLGNFLFTINSEYEDWYKGIVLDLEISENKQMVTKPIFVRQSKKDFSLSLVKGEEKNILNRKFIEYSELIKNESELNQSWFNYINEKKKLYDSYWSPLSFFQNKYTKYILSKIITNNLSIKKGKTLFLNLLRCESHADLSKEILKKN